MYIGDKTVACVMHMPFCAYFSDSQLILIETLQQENAKFAESQAIEEVTQTVSKLAFCCAVRLARWCHALKS